MGASSLRVRSITGSRPSGSSKVALDLEGREEEEDEGVAVVSPKILCDGKWLWSKKISSSCWKPDSSRTYGTMTCERLLDQ